MRWFYTLPDGQQIGPSNHLFETAVEFRQHLISLWGVTALRFTIHAL